MHIHHDHLDTPSAFFFFKKKKNLPQFQRKDTGVNERTAELYSKRGQTNLSGLVVIDETTQCEKCKEHMQKKSPVAHAE